MGRWRWSRLMSMRPLASLGELFGHIVLPTGKWTGTERPGRFARIGRFPTTRFGEVAFTDGIMMRKTLQPFRIQAGVFHTHAAAPGSESRRSTYTGDLINTRVSFAHILDEKRGFRYGQELVTLHGATWRADDHSINTGQWSGFSVVGVGPTFQWRFWDTNFAGAAGVLSTVASQNAIEAIYPNLSTFYCWSQTGTVLMR